MTKDKALKLALEALENHTAIKHPQQIHYRDSAIAAIKEALAQPEQEPVAFDVQKALRRAYHLGQSYWADADSESYAANKRSDKHRQNFDELCEEALAYTTPPKREWVGLTEEQFVEAARLAEAGNYLVAFQRIQQWLKETNT